ncbi:MAG: transposase [Phycisphaerae bacterium]|nr:transposase [Phycisphaerae bacterium]
MARQPRMAPGRIAYHVMNRGVFGLTLFDGEADYAAFERVLAEARERTATRLCDYTLMPNHFHLVLWPREDGDLSRFMQWLTVTHSHRWHAHRQTVGRGRIYQSRFKSFPIQRDSHFLRVCRYVERNPLRAGLVARAEDWPWGSLACRSGREHPADLLCDWPVERPRDWPARVNRAESASELEALRRSVSRGQPYGEADWASRVAERLGLSLRPVGRPRKADGERRR